MFAINEQRRHIDASLVIVTTCSARASCHGAPFKEIDQVTMLVRVRLRVCGRHFDRS
jgi:hypothetical protein